MPVYDPAPAWVLDIDWSAVAPGSLLIAWHDDNTGYTVRSVFQFVCELSNGEPGVYDQHEGIVNAPAVYYTIHPPHPCVPLPRVAGWQIARTERALEFDQTAHGDFPLSWK